ncbi:aureobasidin resistance protein Aur1 [Ascobolus immersus RN42]|uniref:Aureobasidin resistance protein Aur1 n=1 Tax=Ascobolus immersus RN42 TaxID=1160509 RepID=A0A3N4I2X3_ASCIM|nr:aureobasidin resistance protein Aur1 [Ascobolus immersus RN42]
MSKMHSSSNERGTFTKSKYPPVEWSSIPAFIVPSRLKRKIGSRMRSNMPIASSLYKLNNSWDPKDTLRSLRAHRWSLLDGQYLILMVFGIFSLCVIEFPGPLIKTAIATLLMLSLVFPITRQFFLPFLPIAAYLIFFYASGFIPASWRPPIWVRVLPALENVIYGANLSDILSAHTNTFLDLLAWFPYGIGHFVLPFITSAIIFVFAPPKSLPVYSVSFGYLNLIGVAVQFFFPCSPPWYENLYGLAPAHYGMGGSPAGLARIDKLFGIDLYTTNFTNSPVPFGAMPSLHAGTATMHALFLGHIFPKFKYFFYAYVMWIWWATMYLQHHYAVDLIAGSALAVIIYHIAKKRFMTRIQPGKTWRWDYDYVEHGEASSEDYALAPINTFLGADSSDEWTVGSSSSISSGAASPTDSHSLWEGETLGSDSDSINDLEEGSLKR